MICFVRLSHQSLFILNWSAFHSWSSFFLCFLQCCWSVMFIPDSVAVPGCSSWIFLWNCEERANFQRIIELFIQKNVTELSKIWVRDPGKTFPRSKTRGQKGTGSATLIPYPSFFHPVSAFFPFRIPDLHQIWYDPGCSSRIRILIPDPGVKNAPDPGSGSATHVFLNRYLFFHRNSMFCTFRKFSCEWCDL